LRATSTLRLFRDAALGRIVGRMHTTYNHRELALAYHRRLPAHVHAYLESRGIPDNAIHRYRIGWDGEHITIPITDQERRVTFFRLARKPDDHTAPKEIISSAGAYAELYGWERLAFRRDMLVICDGEFDRLILEGHGIPAVTSTAGSDGFLPEWAKEFGKVEKVFVCFHNDEECRHDARHVASLIPHSRIAHLPQDVGAGGGVSDFFLRLSNGRKEFAALLDTANPLSEELIPSPFV
jgi:DNA primase